MEYNRPNEIHKLQRVRAVLYISTPALGADLAELGAWISLNPQIRDLSSAELNSFLQALENQWQNLLRDRDKDERNFPRAFSAYETRPTHGIKIVSRLYASTRTDVNPYPIEANHIDIVKPSSCEHDPYPWAKKRILEAALLPFDESLSTEAHRSASGPSQPSEQQVTASPGAIQIRAGRSIGNITINQAPDVAQIVNSILRAHAQEEATYKNRELFYQRSIEHLTETITELRAQLSASKERESAVQTIQQLAAGQTERAEQLLRERLEQKKAEGQVAQMEAAAAARGLGALAFFSNRNKAIEAYQEAVQLDPNDASSWNELGLLRYRSGNLADAEAAFSRVLEISKRDKTLQGIAYAHLGLVFTDKGKLENAVEVYLKAFDVFQTLGDKRGMAIVYGNLGLVYRTLRDLEQTEVMHRKSLALHEELGNKEGIADQYGNLGWVYRTRGDLQRANDMFQKSLAINEALGRKEAIAASYGDLGILYGIAGDQQKNEVLLQKAEEMLQKSLAISKELGDKKYIAEAYNALGILSRICGDFNQAETLYVDSLMINEAMGRKDGMFSNYVNLANLYRDSGNLERAQEMYNKALLIEHQLGRSSSIEVKMKEAQPPA